MKLIFDNVWSELVELWSHEPRHVVVAYFSCDHGLSFGDQDVLIIDASDSAIASGQTDAAALRRAFGAGAAIYSCKNLHAKIFVLGDRIIVGSANSSLSSRNALIECVAVSENPHSVAEGISFTLALREQSQPVDDQFLKRIGAIPVTRSPRGASRRSTLINVIRPRCWLVGVVYPARYPGNVDFVNSKNEGIAKRPSHIKDQIDWFWWPRDKSKFSKEAKVGDLVIEILSEEDKIVVYCHARICEITTEDSVRAKAYHYARLVDATLGWNEFNALAKRVEWNVPLSRHSCREVPISKSRLMGELWIPE